MSIIEFGFGLIQGNIQLRPECLHPNIPLSILFWDNCIVVSQQLAHKPWKECTYQKLAVITRGVGLSESQVPQKITVLSSFLTFCGPISRPTLKLQTSYATSGVSLF